MKVSQFPDCCLREVSHIQHLLRELKKHAAGGSQRSILGRTIKQLFTNLVFKPANCLTDRWLRAMQGSSGARKTFLLRHGY